MLKQITIRTHPPNAEVEVLCLDSGDARDIRTLRIMKRIQERIGLPIPVQKFFKVAFGISSDKPCTTTTDNY